MTTTWDPSNKGSHINLTTSNHHAQADGTSFGQSVLSTDGKTIATDTGKYYWEVKPNQLSGNNTAVGIADASFNPGSNTGGHTAGGNALNFLSNNVWAGCALDMANKRFWIRGTPTGNWNNSGTANPATNTGGTDISAFSTTVFGAFFIASGGNEQADCNFGDSSFTGTAPSGFIPYQSSNTIADAPFFQETNQFFSPTVTNNHGFTAPFYNDIDHFYGPTVTGGIQASRGNPQLAVTIIT